MLRLAIRMKRLIIMYLLFSHQSVRYFLFPAKGLTFIAYVWSRYNIELVAKLKRLGKLIKESVIIALKKKGGQEMTEILCPTCKDEYSDPEFTVRCTGYSELRGIIKCTRCLHEMPFSMYHDRIQQLDIALPGVQSDQLNSLVVPDITEDVQEAERCNYHQCYKACVTMCRRALQLSLIDKGIEDKPLGRMLEEAKTIPNLLTDETYGLATSIKHFGDIGAHRKEPIEPEVAKLVIYATVRMLNEIFK